MIAVRLITLEDAEAILESYGCKRLQGKTKLNTANWWQWPWGGTPFTLPFDGPKVDKWAVDKLIAQMSKEAPDGWEFPPSKR